MKIRDQPFPVVYGSSSVKVKEKSMIHRRETIEFHKIFTKFRARIKIDECDNTSLMTFYSRGVRNIIYKHVIGLGCNAVSAKYLPSGLHHVS